MAFVKNSQPLAKNPIKKEPTGLTHQEVCEHAGRWLRTKCNCGIAFVEHKVSHSAEIPDALGFRDYGQTSILLEIKVSRSDFLSDKKKPHRVNPDQGIGDYRMYVAPKGIIKESDLPPGWGLLECSPKGRIKIIKGPENITSLSGVDRIKESIEWHKKRVLERGKRYNGPSPYMKAELKKCQDFLFPEKNRVAESALLYGAMRCWVLASEAGVDCTLNEKYYTNPMKGMRKSTIDSCKNMVR